MPDLEAIRIELTEERDGLVSRLRELGVDPGGESLHLGTDEGFADSGAVTAEKGELITLAGKLRESLADVESALTKIGAGTYGACEHCGGQIAAARLEALPSAKLCRACAASDGA